MHRKLKSGPSVGVAGVISDTYVVLLSMVILIRLYTAVHGTYLRVRCARTGVKVIYVSGSLSNVCLEHISLVISVPPGTDITSIMLG